MNPSEDLLTRLRSHGPERHDARALMNEAAAEIGRLRIEAKKVRFAPATGHTLEQQRRNIPAELRNLGDARLIWVNEGDLCFVGQQVGEHSLSPAQEAMDWLVSDSQLAGHILNVLGIGADASLEPGADWRRDKVAKLIREHLDALNPPAS